MKKIITTIAIFAALITGSQAQDKVNVNQGFWVIENNINLPKVQTVKFYSADKRLMYEETVYTKLNLKKKKTLVALNQILDKLNERTAYIESRNLVTLSLNLKH
ncbi:hypothetical protein [Mucilaginibacter celer]|uniref:Uncharacterized protein n=1 Tax=Mucilaginibacter celer TaxID=2305508 RepID=A0A494W193_9SPHI|nr:hypothetical protein [Mucilaginibacter celer]AYL97318.1 hypothetical protein HYN43_019275 [Mucilaginibacter celer]